MSCLLHLPISSHLLDHLLIHNVKTVDMLMDELGVDHGKIENEKLQSLRYHNENPLEISLAHHESKECRD